MQEGIKKSRWWIWLIVVIIALIFITTVGLALVWFFLGEDYESARISDYSVSESPSYAPSGIGTLEKAATEEIAYDEDYQESEADTAAGEVSEQKVIKTGSLDMIVDEVGKSAEKIVTAAKSKEGFVQSSNIYTSDDGEQTATVIIKVPAAKFEETLNELRDLANFVESENVSGTDVTEEYVDLQAQLKNYRAEEEQYLNILERADTVDETLKVTRQLSIVRGNIERLEGRIKYLENLTDLSTITVYLSQEVTVDVPTTEWRPLTNIKTAFKYWVRALQWLVDVLVWIVLFLGPVVLVIWLFAWLIIRRVRKKKSEG